ncbi:RNA-binding cell elongation regulator Jag/EloR [Anaerovibrio sp.]|uniref:RNA-binding cell elongation regulator Jag/EloR n=1 Tax=Anaerovibrio sp. TaxID=1872532 RepID=UPI001B6C9C72|nr:RNA-binding cell elongation regulator Jag/EloR [Anaerovibrio sp.]MBP3232312.1 protein jag [Anaerovibrio sp.]MBR2141646.1 protein jag [Anaerovibrio sp.]
MSLEVEMTGRTVEEAKSAAIEALGISADLVDFVEVTEPTKGFLGLIGGKPAKVKAVARELSPLDKADKFLSDIFKAMNLEVKIEKNYCEDGTIFNLIGENLGILIGKHGQTLDSLQYLSNLAANRGLVENKTRIILDVESYRSRREETLRRLAVRLADKVKRTGERIVLEPMNRHERKIIHMALQDNHRIATYSSGDEPYRKVVIELKRGGRRDYHERRDREEESE